MQKLFEKNIRFFYSSLPLYYDLIKRIKSRRFQLKNNNIYDSLTGEYIYPNSIDDSKEFSFYPTHNSNWEKEFFEIDLSKWNENDFFITGRIVNKIIDKATKLTSFNKGFYFDKNFLPTTAIFGILAGKHIDELVKNFEFQSLFIYEPNVEFFAISLYFIDYEFMYKKLGERLFLWIGGEIDYFAIEKFYYERVITSTFLNLTLKTYNHPLIENAYKKFKEVRATKLRGWGSYEDEIRGIKNHFKNINKYPLLTNFKKVNAPFCVVANGKSLEKNIEFIKKNRNSMIIVSVGTALKPLIKAGIESDFHIEQERIDILFEALKDVLPNYNGYFVGASVVNPKIFEMAKNPLMYIREGFSLDKFYPKLIGSSPIVGNSGFAFSAFLSNEIYLCGMDLGWIKGEKKHASNSFYDDREDIENSGIEIEGNFNNKIYTDSLFLSSKKNLEVLISKLNLKVYNLSYGAKIKNTIPLNDKKLPLINKEKIKQEILNSFNNITFEHPKLNLSPFLTAISKTLDKKVTNYKELTGLIDYIEDSIKSLDYPEINTLLKGSIFHILNKTYITAHKIDIKEIKKLFKIIQKEIFKYQEDFLKIC